MGDSHLEILTGPDFPLSVSNTSRILKNRPLLTLFMGFAAGCFLILMYVQRKTYKSASAVQRRYKNMRFFRVAASASDKRSRRKGGRPWSAPKQEDIRKTALQVLQMLRQEPKTAHIPVMFLTGLGTREAVSRVMELKPEGYVLKSVTRDDLLKTLAGKLHE